MRTDDIFQDYGKLVYRYLLRLCGDKDLAEELMQETFLPGGEKRRPV